MLSVRRTLASLLTAVLAIVLIAPELLANLGSDLPACCRRDGRHHCDMSAMDDGSAAPGSASMRAEHAKCEQYPGPSTAPAGSQTGFFASFAAAPVPSISAAFSQAFPQQFYKLSRTSSHPKRGPPAGSC